MSENEEWRSVARCPGYEVSSLGRVRSWKPLGSRCAKPASPRLIRLQLVSGYYAATMYGQDGKKLRRINRLVAEAFHGAPEHPRMEAAHENGDKLDNRASNLVWKEHVDNIADKARHGTLAVGERHGMAKVNAENVVDIRRSRANGSTLRELAERYGVDISTISLICLRKKWRHVA